MAGNAMAGIGGTRPPHNRFGGHDRGWNGGDPGDPMRKDAEGKTKADRQLESKNSQEHLKGAANKALENYKNGMGIRDSLKSGVNSLAQANRNAVPANWNISDALKEKKAAAEEKAASDASAAAHSGADPSAGN
jgi:hypothetical protein